jgi:integrase
MRLYRASGQAVVVLGKKTFYLGKFGLEATTQNYHRVVAERLANNRQLRVDPEQITVKEMLARFWLHAETHYVRSSGRASSELGNYQTVMRYVKKLYADTPACKFGPMALRVVREQMVQQGWCRKSVNRMVGRVKGIFRWATEQELIPGGVYHSMMALAGLRKGYSDAPESQAVRPVPMELVMGIKPFVSSQVWAMIELQLLTAARSGELCSLRPCDPDRSGWIWMYRPSDHKTAYRDMERIIYIGPRAQRVLAKFMLRAPESFCFSPAEAYRKYLQERSESRVTPEGHGNCAGRNRAENPQRFPGEQYDVSSYRRAITRACDLAFPLPAHLGRRRKSPRRLESEQEWLQRLTPAEKQEIRQWRKAYRWHPHQLRHNAATEVRKEFGLETARIILGHHSPAVTLIYAEADHKKAVEAMEKVG